MTDPFSSPASSSGLPLNDLKGRLLLVTPKRLEEGIVTDFGVKEAVRADAVVLDGEDAGSTHDEVLVFPLVLIGQLRPRIGKGMVLGRLSQRPPAKKGQNPAWSLDDPTDADKDVARKFLAERADQDPFA